MAGDDASADPGGGASELERRLLGGPRRYTREEVAAATGVELPQARRYWRAMGFADVGDEAVAFTAADVEALQRVRGLVREGVLDEEFAVGMTRALGHTMARLVVWQVEALIETLTEQRGLDEEEATRAAVDLAAVHLEDLERLLLYAWRRQLAAVTGRALGAADRHASRNWLTVGFADLVSYTRISQRMDERELARVVSRFESACSDLVAAHGGRLVKTVGDEVLFVTDRAEDAGRTALALAEAMAADEVLPDVRVGLATGSVVARMGDVFGRTVNLASRLTAMAQAGTVLVDRETAQALAGHPDFTVSPGHIGAVRGLGFVEPALLRRAGADGTPPAGPAGRAGTG